MESHWVLLARIESLNSTHRKILHQTSEVWLDSYVLRSDLLTGLCNRIMAKFGGGTERWIIPHSLKYAGKQEQSCHWFTLSEPCPTVLDCTVIKHKEVTEVNQPETFFSANYELYNTQNKANVWPLILQCIEFKGSIFARLVTSKVRAEFRITFPLFFPCILHNYSCKL